MDIEQSLAVVKRLAPQAAIAREAATLRRDAIEGSLALAGSPLNRPQLDALASRGIAAGDHRLEDYLAARDLIVAAGWVAEQRPIDVADPRPLLTVEDVRRLHAFATTSQPMLRPGVWRLGVEPAPGGIVSPPPWQIAKETAALADRFRRRPAPDAIPAWLTAFLTRYARIRPFTGANGRAGRLAAALLVRRLDLVPLAIARDDAPAFDAALLAALGGKSEGLRALIETSLLRGCLRLIAAAGTEPLQPLRALAGDRYAALIKAAKRGNLAAVTRDGRVYSTTAWIDDYRAHRYGAGRR